MRSIKFVEHSDEYDSYYAFVEPRDDDAEQSGIKGMRWGVRRWQNEDGSLTPAGRVHYGVGTKSTKEVVDAVARDRASAYKKVKNGLIGTIIGGPGLGTAAGLLLTKTKGKGYEKLVQEYKDSPEFKNLEKILENETSNKQKNIDISNNKPSSTNGAEVNVTRDSNSSESNKKNWSTDDISKQSDKERMQRIKSIENMHGNGMTFKEIAKKLGISEGSVKNYYYYYN